MRDEGYPLLSSDQLLQETQECISLLIRDLGHDIIRPLALKVQNQARFWALTASIRLDAIDELVPADDGLKDSCLLALDLAENLALGINSPAFIQPEMLP
jgi:hypothetical protein